MDAEWWVLNAAGDGKPYRIYVAEDSGKVDPHPLPLPSQYELAAWPSGIAGPSGARVYASVRAAEWSEVGLWEGSPPSSLTWTGVVFAADQREEPWGIGPTVVVPPTRSEHPYLMYYLVRGSGGPGSTIALASSSDGYSWERAGIVYQNSRPDVSGLSLSHACRHADGSMMLFFHEYLDDAYSVARGAVARGEDWFDTFDRIASTVLPDAREFRIAGSRGESIADVHPPPPVGLPLVVYEPGTGQQEVVVATDVEDGRTELARPLEHTWEGAAARSFASRKVELSWTEQRGDGSWVGVATGYGSWDNVTSEYTATAFSPAVSGPWSIGGGLRFSPYFEGGNLSTENPARIVANDRC